MLWLAKKNLHRRQMKKLTELETWKSLTNHAGLIHSNTGLTRSPCDLQDNNNVTTKSITLDYSAQLTNQFILEELFNLANQRQLKAKIIALMTGGPLNISENRPALHTALRAPESDVIDVQGQNIMMDVHSTRERIKTISDKIRSQQWLGYSGKAIKNIVNIGIGGSDLGPRFCIHALADYCLKDLGYYFITSADPHGFNSIISKLEPETTLFIVSSKSFHTKETLYNTQKAMSWMGAHTNQFDKHFIAVTARPEKAQQLGIHNTLPIWDWIGGRFSVCSAINLITAIAIGYEQFSQFLAGAYHMDQHFVQTEFKQNLPVLMALLGIWNINFLHHKNLLLLNYTDKLEHFTAYIQQLDMESNGKSINNQGRTVNYATGPMVWGGLGNQIQHSYYQLLCQGTHKFAIDVISLKSLDGELINEICQENKQILNQGVHNPTDPNGYIHGLIPMNHIKLDCCTPFNIGELIALYEHKIFTQSVIWDINPFDQPGVGSAKQASLQSKLTSATC